MTAMLLDGRGFAKELQGEIAAEVEAYQAQYGHVPRLAVVQVAGDEAADRYVRSIRKRCSTVGLDVTLEYLPAETTQAQLDAAIAALSADSATHGILLQMPLPAPLSTEAALRHLNHEKDVDGIHPINAGLLAQGRAALVPNTPAGGVALLRHYDIPLEGQRVAIVGRSAIVGRPLAALLINAHATVTVCHSRTKDLAAVLRASDMVCVAAGSPGLVRGDMLSPGVVVVDFGINVLPDGTLTGDVDAASVEPVAGALTPVPGGTGPVTNMMLLRNVLAAARHQMGSA
jgi:methylenetetrahydrofolate dehydrogenase (NADP+) / methenyltetrahydrofolate cyclohydrolase